MADTFTVTLPGNWHQRWPEVQNAARKYNFKVNKAGNEIDFDGMGVAGNIVVNGNTAHVTIDRKPFFLSMNLIAGWVKDFLTRNT
jgi:hypothetical protein